MKNFLNRRLVLNTSALSLGVAILLVPTLSATASTTFIPINSQVNYGETSANVSNLQMFLAANASIYPDGLVTGYYGPLTRAAVIRFQNQYGIDPAGRVGPVTLAKINSLIATGGWTASTDVSGPWISSVGQNVSRNSATFSWNTDEVATAKIFYHTSPVMMNEGDINSVGFGSLTGSTATSDNVTRTSHQVTISGLQPNTRYYYVIVATDAKGNVSLWNPNTSFVTPQ